jgi:hypothetical protein
MKAETGSHTAGNWSVHGDKKTLIGGPTNKMMIAEVLHQHVCVSEWDRPLEEAQANARLIAAAPNLLSALKVMVAAFTAAVDLDENDVDLDGFEYKSVRQARAAIANAEGRSA